MTDRRRRSHRSSSHAIDGQPKPGALCVPPTQRILHEDEAKVIARSSGIQTNELKDGPIMRSVLPSTFVSFFYRVNSPFPLILILKCSCFAVTYVRFVSERPQGGLGRRLGLHARRGGDQARGGRLRDAPGGRHCRKGPQSPGDSTLVVPGEVVFGP